MFRPLTHTFAANGASPEWEPRTRNTASGRPIKMEGTVSVGSGSFGSGTLALQVFDGITWINVPSASLTAAGLFTFAVFGLAIRLNLTGATSPAFTALLNSEDEYAVFGAA